MEKDQTEKKIWVDPELTFMPMEVIKSHSNSKHSHESLFVRQITYSGGRTDAPTPLGS